MSKSLYSSSWYRVSPIRPLLKRHVGLHRHHYRGQLWYVIEDHASGRVQRFTPAAYQIIGLMDGSRSVQQIWDVCRDQMGDQAPSQEEVIRLLSQLHAADLIQSETLPDTAELLKRFEKRQKGRWQQNLRSPLFMRFRLIDPERFLNRFEPLVRPLFGWPGAILWLAAVGAAAFQAGVHWPELTENITDRILAPANLVILWLTYPVLKALHEFGHGFAVKINGGEVHEMGIMMLVLTPIPYVDASAASAFARKSQRMLVGAAGMAVELFVAALALFVWIASEPGPVRSVAFNVIFIAGVSSLLFNGNPLLRYDAYYILSDLLEIPNLASRAMAYLGYLFQRYGLGITDAEPPLSTPGERIWFVVYAVASWSYRLFVYAAIVLFIAGKFFFIGVMFAVWAVVSMFVLPIGKAIKFLAWSPRLRQRRVKAAIVAGGIALMVVSFLTFLPLPLCTQAEGIIWVAEQTLVRAGADGFVDKVLVEPGTPVGSGTPLIVCVDPFLPAEIQVLESQRRELEAMYDTQLPVDRVKAEITQKEIRNVAAKLADARRRSADLQVSSPAAGIFTLPRHQDLPGRFARRGELLGYILDRGAICARVVVYQADVDLVRQKTVGVGVRLPEAIGTVLAAQLQREVPAATDRLPGKALSQEGGGQIAIDPRDSLGIKAFQKVFLFDILLPPAQGLYPVGGRVHVLFNHGSEPIVYRWFRNLRNLFLKQFNV